MITLHLKDGKVLRLRQKKLLGVLTAEILGESNERTGFRAIEKRALIRTEELAEFFDGKLRESLFHEGR